MVWVCGSRYACIDIKCMTDMFIRCLTRDFHNIIVFLKNGIVPLLVTKGCNVKGERHFLGGSNVLSLLALGDMSITTTLELQHQKGPNATATCKSYRISCAASITKGRDTGWCATHDN